MEEKIKFDQAMEKAVKDDEREGDRIRMQKKHKMHQEKELRDEQLYLERK
jgi:hypothetical protein